MDGKAKLASVLFFVIIIGPIATLIIPDSNVEEAFNAENNYLAGRGVDDNSSIINWTLANSLQYVDQEAKSFSFSSNGTLLATGYLGGIVTVDDDSSNIWLTDYSFPDAGININVNSVEFSPDDNFLAVGHDAGLSVWNVSTWSEVVSYTNITVVYSLCFSPDGKQLATGGSDGNVRIWNTTTWDEEENYSASPHRIASLAYSPNGSMLISGSTYFVGWNTSNWSAIFSIPGEFSPGGTIIYSIEFSPQGDVFVTGERCVIRIWNTTNVTSVSRHEIDPLGDYCTAAYDISFSSDGNYLAFGSYDSSQNSSLLGGKISILDTNSWSLSDIIAPQRGKATALEFRPGDSLLASGGSEGEGYQLWVRDSDDDGIMDSADACSGTAQGFPADDNGCSASQRDTDDDGLVDSLDQCPGTEVGIEVDDVGCWWGQFDTDGDGVENKDDNCPNLANEDYCGTDGEYIPVSYIDVKAIDTTSGSFTFNNWDISPDGKLLALNIGAVWGCGGETAHVLGGMAVISLENISNYGFCEFAPIVFYDVDAPNSGGTKKLQSRLQFSNTGDVLHYDGDRQTAGGEYGYDTSDWSITSHSPFEFEMQGSYFTNKGTNVIANSSQSFTIKDVYGEQVTIFTNSTVMNTITGTDDSRSLLVATTNDDSWTLSFYDIYDGFVKDIGLPVSFHSYSGDITGELYNVKISSNGLYIIVHCHSCSSEINSGFIIYERDRDSDGYPDTEDLCQEIAGEINGCLEEYFDTDGDGINDKDDQCPGTTEGTNVDSIGCASNQIDTDADGISDASDQCPNTSNDESVGLTGCSSSQVDTDGDGVYDSQDNCPSTPAGTTVDSTGCGPNDVVDLDSDGDGVRDSIDECSESENGIIVDSKGCETSGDVQKSEETSSSNDDNVFLYLIVSALVIIGFLIFFNNYDASESTDYDFSMFESSDSRVETTQEYTPTLVNVDREENKKLQNIVAELERKKRQSESEIFRLRQQQSAQKRTELEIAAMQREMNDLQLKVEDAENAKAQLENEMEEILSEKESSINLQDSVIGGDAITSGGTKIESQTIQSGLSIEEVTSLLAASNNNTMKAVEMMMQKMSDNRDTSQDKKTESIKIDDEGYEWKEHKDGSTWYRLANSDDKWSKWED